MNDTNDAEQPEKKSPVLKLKDGGAGSKETLARFRGTILDTKGDNFLGSGLSFSEWSVTADRLRYDRWYGTQGLQERRRRMAFLIRLCAEQERLVESDIHATGISQSVIEDLIQGDWNGVKCGIETLEFNDDRPDYRLTMKQRFAKFRAIAQQAYDGRTKVFCPVCMRPAPTESIAGFHDGRHICPWCEVVHDDDGNWVERNKANLSISTDGGVE